MVHFLNKIYKITKNCIGFSNKTLRITSVAHQQFSAKMATVNKPSVYITREVNDNAINLLKEKCNVTWWTGPGPMPRGELLKKVSGITALFCMLTDKIDAEVLDKAGKNLKIIATMSVGYDHLAVDEIKKRGILISYTPDILTDATAELAVALLLATSRRLPEAIEEARNGGWKAWAPFWMCGYGLKDSTVGIVGFGRIGQEIAKRLKPFKPSKILYYNRTDRPAEAKAIGAERASFDDLIKQSDFISVSVALTEDTKQIFNAETFRKMKPNAIFVNTSRGGVVDQNALIEALEKKIIHAAGLDVTTPEPLPLNSPLFKLKNCVVLPHIGSASIETRNAMAELCAKNILACIEGKDLLTQL